MPGFSVTVKLSVPPSNVGVLPRIVFAELIRTTLCEMAELLVNLIVTVPALTVSLLVSNVNMSSIGAKLMVLAEFVAGGLLVGGVVVFSPGAGSLPVAPRR